MMALAQSAEVTWREIDQRSVELLRVADIEPVRLVIHDDELGLRDGRVGVLAGTCVGDGSAVDEVKAEVGARSGSAAR